MVTALGVPDALMKMVVLERACEFLSKWKKGYAGNENQKRKKIETENKMKRGNESCIS